MVASRKERHGNQLHRFAICDMGKLLATVAASGEQYNLRLQLGECLLRDLHGLCLVVLSSWSQEEV